jgi:hypothetical protein
MAHPVGLWVKDRMKNKAPDTSLNGGRNHCLANGHLVRVHVGAYMVDRVDSTQGCVQVSLDLKITHYRFHRARLQRDKFIGRLVDKRACGCIAQFELPENGPTGLSASTRD